MLNSILPSLRIDKNCKKTSRKCGNACLSKSRTPGGCRKKASKRSSRSPKGLPSEDVAKSKYTLIGEGISGRVYSDGQRAIKYTPLVTDPLHRARVKAKNESDLKNMKRVASLGIAPKIYKVNSDKNVYSMDLLEGYQEGIGPHDIGSKKQKPFDKTFISHLKTLNSAKLFPADLKEDNVMFHPQTGDIKLIDQGSTRPGDAKSRIRLFTNTHGDRPLGADVIKDYINNYGTREARRQYKKLAKRVEESLNPSPLSQSAKKNVTSKDYESMLDELFAIALS